jgi:hypothetical protein
MIKEETLERLAKSRRAKKRLTRIDAAWAEKWKARLGM